MLVGNGVIRREASGHGAAEALAELVGQLNLPVTHTFMGKGCLDYRNLHSLGTVGLQRPGADLAAMPQLEEADLVLEMDSDFSHDPADVPRLIAAASDSDVALGSRYVEGGRIELGGELGDGVGGRAARPVASQRPAEQGNRRDRSGDQRRGRALWHDRRPGGGPARGPAGAVRGAAARDGLGARRNAMLPTALCWASIVIGASLLTPVGFFGFILVPVWLIVVGIWLSRSTQTATPAG